MGNWYSYKPEPDPAFIPKILEIQVDPLCSDPYGMLRQAILHLEGKLNMAFSIPEASNGIGHPQDIKLISVATQQEIGRVHYDIPLCSRSAPPSQPNIVCLMCCLDTKSTDGVDMWTFALVLQPVLHATEGTPGTMRRVGLASRIKPEFWNNAKTMRFKIY